VKFLIDMPLPPGLADWLRTQGHEAIHAAGVGLSRAPDLEIMARATQEGRTVVTADLDYPRLLALAGSPGPSVILFRGGDWGEADIIMRLQQILAQLSETDILQSIIVIDRSRVRRRRLPLA
jgi:predicted nuclease of predicted toxin-antitoxin system